MSSETPPPDAEKPTVTSGGLAVDPGNQFISVAPSALTVSCQNTPLGQRLFATVRTVNATVTATLTADEVDNWIEALRRERARMTGLIVPGTLTL